MTVEIVVTRGSPQHRHLISTAKRKESKGIFIHANKAHRIVDFREHNAHQFILVLDSLI